MTLPQEVENMLKKYESSNDDNPSLIQVSAIPRSEVIAI